MLKGFTGKWYAHFVVVVHSATLPIITLTMSILIYYDMNDLYFHAAAAAAAAAVFEFLYL